MASDLVAELDVVPVLRNVRQSIIRQSGGDFGLAGRDLGDRAGREASKSFSTRMRHGLKEGLGGIGLGLVAGLGIERLFDSIIEESEQAIRVTKLTAQEIATTGGAAHLTAGEVNELAKNLSEYAAIDDEVIQGGENILLTFRKVRNEVGAGNDIFNRATKASLDLSTVLKTDLLSTTKQLGKALNDPVKGITALGRAGVQFTAGQKAQIAALVKNNQLLDAQKIILAQVEHNVGGAAGANATAFDRLKVSMANLEESAGTVLIPALDKVAEVTTDDVIPSIRTGGGIVQDFAHTWGDLPEPIKAATLALVAFRLVQATSIGSAASAQVVSALGSVKRGVGEVTGTVGAMSAQFRAARSPIVGTFGELELLGPASTRAGAGLSALRVGAQRAGQGIKAGLSGALGIVGGPWGAAFIAGTAIVAHFWQEHQRAEQRIQAFSSTLDKETGALTQSSREFVANELLQSGAFKQAQQLGISLSQITSAALGQKAALSQVNAELEAFIPKQQRVTGRGASGAVAMGVQGNAAVALRRTIGGLNGVVDQSTGKQKLLAEATGETATANDGAIASTKKYVSEIDQARSSIKKLEDAENKRRSGLLGQFQDATALAQQIRDARKEAADGARTLDGNTEAGLKNRDALGQLAAQWNNSANSVKNAKGAYSNFRSDFIQIAEQMGATKGEAKHLADQIIHIPTNKVINVNTPGMKEAREQARLLKLDLLAAQTAGRNISIAQGNRNRSDDRGGVGRAGGGSIFGRGSKTSDSIPIWASTGEFMQRAAAVDFYGLPFMNAINNLQLPRFAGGGAIGAAPVAPVAPSGQSIVGTLSWDRDGMLTLRGVIREEINAHAAGQRVERRGAAAGGSRRRP